jgi:hypothetical protein
MKRKVSKLSNAGYLTVLSCVVLFGATTVSTAQTISLPKLAFPNAGTSWGCQFYGTCQSNDVTTIDE